MERMLKLGKKQFKSLGLGETNLPPRKDYNIWGFSFRRRLLEGHGRGFSGYAWCVEKLGSKSSSPSVIALNSGHPKKLAKAGQKPSTLPVVKVRQIPEGVPKPLSHDFKKAPFCPMMGSRRRRGSWP